jgi:hypothetical protein
MVCLRNISVDTLHKGGTEDNNNNNNNNKKIGVKLDNEHKYDHVPKCVETSREAKVTLFWNQQLRADRTIIDNKPGIIIRDNKEGTCMLLDVAMPGDINMIKKEAAKILKYRELVI